MPSAHCQIIRQPHTIRSVYDLYSSLCQLVDDQMSDQEDTETSASTLPRPKSVTEGSAFDENSLNQPQFIHLLEKFLGNTPVK